mgnify:CR=1 FL=1
MAWHPSIFGCRAPEAPPTGARRVVARSRAFTRSPDLAFMALGSDAAPETAFTMADAATAETMIRHRAATACARAPLPLGLSLSGLGLRLRCP